MTDNSKNWTAWGGGGRSAIGTLICGLLLAGCGSGAYQSAPVNGEKARETLAAALEGWKSGETIEDLKDGSPSIVVQDFDWSNGIKLVDYQVVDEGDEVDANLVAKVKLSLESKEGAKSEKTVTYVVGTAPVLTVFRDMFK